LGRRGAERRAHGHASPHRRCLRRRGAGGYRAGRTELETVLSRRVLASASPRRQALVELLGGAWRVAAADVDEMAFFVSEPLASAVNIAQAKARATRAEADEVVRSE